MFDVRLLPLPIIAAPMAGGPSSPRLAAAVTAAGGLGTVPGGSISADALRAAIRATRLELAELGVPTDAPIGANLFVPRSANTAEGPIVDHEAHRAAVATYVAELSSRLQLDPSALGTPNADDDDDWDSKLEVLETEGVAVATFTFGLPRASVFERLHDVGIVCGVMVSNARDARAATEAGADIVIAQGVEAGGHRSTWRVAEVPNGDDTLTVVAEVWDALHHLGAARPAIVAAGGIDGPARFAAARDAGADLAQVGTALLLTDEAGTRPTVRAALTDPAITATAATRAFSGRVARCLRNGFVDAFDALAPGAYPDVNQITAPIRARAEAAGDVHGVSAYAGVRWRDARGGAAADVARGIVG